MGPPLPFRIELLEVDCSGEADEAEFAFLEELSQAEHDVRNVVEGTVLESLVGTELWEKAETYMGTETRRIAQTVKEWAHGG